MPSMFHSPVSILRKKPYAKISSISVIAWELLLTEWLEKCAQD